MSGSAWAQGADVAGARAIAGDGFRAFDAGDYATAEQKLALACEVVQVPTTCHERD